MLVESVVVVWHSSSPRITQLILQAAYTRQHLVIDESILAFPGRIG